MKLQDKITVFTSGVNAFYKDGRSKSKSFFSWPLITLNFLKMALLNVFFVIGIKNLQIYDWIHVSYKWQTGCIILNHNYIKMSKMKVKTYIQ